MSEIDSNLDNQPITTETLNDIAIDLGATTFDGLGEEKFGVDELNNITSALVSSGILLSDNKCAVSIVDGMIKIDTGIIVFSSGAKKKITEALSVELVNGSFIYALHDTVYNKCNIIVSETAPTDGDFVNLCEIALDGTLIDKRVISKAKVELPTEGSSFSFSHKVYEYDFNNFNGTTFTVPTENVSEIYIVANTAMFVYDVKNQSFTGYEAVYDKAYNNRCDNVQSVMIRGWSGSSSGSLHLSVESQTDSITTFKYISSYSGNTYYGTINIKYSVFGGAEK